MANPQLEDGFLKIANTIWERWAKIRVPGCAEQVLKVIIRRTYGFNKKSDRIALSQLSDDTGMSKPHVLRAVKVLTTMNLVTQKGNTKGVTYWFNKNYETWKPLPKKVTLPRKATGVTEKGNASLPKKATTVAKLGTTKYILKDTTTKNTSTKDTLAQTQDQLRSLYTEICEGFPEAQPVEDWSPKRQGNVNARWKKHPDLNWWRGYFERVAASDFLRNGNETWKADFGWIMLPSNMEKILEGRYDNKKSKVKVQHDRPTGEFD